MSGNYPAGVGMYDIPGFRDEDAAAELERERFEERISSPETAEFAATYLTELACEQTGLELPEDIAWHKAEQHRASQKIVQHMLNHSLDQFARLVAAAEAYYRLIAEMDRDRAAKRCPDCGGRNVARRMIQDGPDSFHLCPNESWHRALMGTI